MEYFQPAGVVLLASYVYENVRAAASLEVEGVSERLVEQPWSGGPALLQPQHRCDGHRPVPARPEQLVRPAGAGRRRRRLGGRQLRPLRPRLHRRRKSLGVFRPAADRRGRHEHVREERRGGAPPGRRSSSRTPTAGIRRTFRRPRFRTRTTISIWIRPSRIRLGFPVCRITADYKDNERKVAAFIQDKMAEWFMAAGAVATEKAPHWRRWAPRRTPTAARGWATTPRRTSSNRWGFSHEAPNLGILGASVMGTSGARNPTLTAQALAWRTAEYLAKNWKTIAT